MRIGFLLALVALNLGLLLARPAAAVLWVYPVAPPLTHIPEMGEPLLGAADAPPTPPQGRPPGGPQSGQVGPQGGPRGLPGYAGLVDRVIRTVGSAEQKVAVGKLRPADTRALQQRAMELRLAVQTDAVVIAEVLGPERVATILARKDTLSTRYGEGRAWATAIERTAP